MRELLSRLTSIYPLSREAQQYLIERLRSMVLLKKEHVPEPEHHVYYVTKGLLRTYYFEEKQEVCASFAKEREVIITPGLLQNDKPEFIQAIEDSVLWYIRKDELQALYRQFPESNIVARELYLRLYLLVEERLRLLRTRDATGRYLLLMKTHPDLVLRVPAKLIASYLGVSDETLSRIRSRIK
ncbi:MAG: Crp/Fnr family transcriptional regulator [Chitinophagaceae bacterium]|nr:Crp/Fnr family transcriptional regulator [Chitinophagaceae bacterium]